MPRTTLAPFTPAPGPDGARRHSERFFTQPDRFVNECETEPRKKVAAAFLSAAVGR